MKPNIIKLLIVTNIVIFLISSGIIFFKITAPQPTVVSAKKTVLTEQKIPTTVTQPVQEEKQILTQDVENITQKIIQTTKQPSDTKQNKNIKQQKKIVPPPLAKTEVETATGYVEKENITVRNIKFVFFSRQAKKVSLIGDFNDWTPQSLIKVSENRWELTVKISGGKKYLYNFLVDGKVTLDPNNNKPPEISPQGFKSSVLSL
ncbi:MAG: hypothetical protein SNJ64_06580 [Endomicrobiia bacterium]